MLWYSKNKVFDNGPKDRSSSWVSRRATTESIPYCSSGASDAIRSMGNEPDLLDAEQLQDVHEWLLDEGTAKSLEAQIASLENDA